MLSEELVARLNDGGYKNWLKAGRCLLILKGGLHPVTSKHMRAFHRDLLLHNPVLQTQCHTAACRPRGNKFSMACRVCTEWQTVILRHHRQPGASVNWDNCVPPQWRTDYWEVAKAYMPRGQGKVKRADQCDASALLNLINFCDCFQSVETKYVREVIRYRNELMHSCELHVEDEWMKHYRMTLKRFIQQFSHVPQMERVGRDIDEMLTVDLSVCVSGLDKVDSVTVDKTELHAFHEGASSTDLIGQWEAELLREKLQELLHDDDDDDDDENMKDSEPLKRLSGFLQANSDLGARFSAELQTINSLQDRK
ncbi:uncharacterized protein CXorf38-like isoform X2 [Solea solea]|uniref:uncharacterized protein CXorf38-like isoform X2 n=1 Tax=Solea solea TaxID=90069 RepID=UPI00272CB136|nr:uncharacterized protein CXorf38-like isoform X2 [Solea solea]